MNGFFFITQSVLIQHKHWVTMKLKVSTERLNNNITLHRLNFNSPFLPFCIIDIFPQGFTNSKRFSLGYREATLFGLSR